MNGESSVVVLREALKLHHEPHPWDDLWRAMAVEHPLHDEWWDARDLVPLLDRVEVPTYLGCDWQNVPLHLPSTFPTFRALVNAPEVRVAMLGEFGLTWPWESLHVEALAWYDHWLKGQDTGIVDGDPIRYFVPGADEWRTSTSWPPAGAALRAFALRADGTLGDDEGDAGTRALMTLGGGLGRARPSDADPPSRLEWTSEALTDSIDLIGDVELELHAAATAIDTAWFVTLQDVAPDGTAVDVTEGYLRASMREVDEQHSSPGAPLLPCRVAEPLVPGELTVFRIPLVSTARRFESGHCVRLVVASDDQDSDVPAMMGFRHASVGTSSVNTVHSASRLLVPVC
jgi:predicted acyl esterase